MSSYVKDPDAKLDYIIDWSDWLDGDTISTSAWTVPAGITQSVSPAASNTTTTATIWLEGGTVDTSYAIVNRITTATGRINDETIRVAIRQR